MSPVIRVPSDIYSRLENHAKGFDTPAGVIEKLLNHFEGIDSSPSHEKTDRASPRNRDIKKYDFNKQAYGKGRLVLAVVKEYISNNPHTSFNELLEIFPKNIQGSTGVFSRQDDAQDIYERTGHKRHFVKPDELIQLSDCVIAVSAEWGRSNINNLIQQAQSIGYTISPV